MYFLLMTNLVRQRDAVRPPRPDKRKPVGPMGLRKPSTRITIKFE